jgi:hypothetical protein
LLRIPTVLRPNFNNVTTPLQRQVAVTVVAAVRRAVAVVQVVTKVAVATDRTARMNDPSIVPGFRSPR